MDRIIKYRGISVVTNEWVYGSLICDSYHPEVVNKVEGHYRIVTSSGPYEWVVVKNESIGQFTGRLDKNNKEIWEGNIVKYNKEHFDAMAPFGEEIYYKDVISTIVFRDHGFWVEDEDFGWEGETLWDWDSIEVISNVWDEMQNKILQE